MLFRSRYVLRPCDSFGLVGKKERGRLGFAYGSDGISPDLLLKMTVRRITETLYEYSETLITLCVRLLQAEQVHETLLRYLCMHYVGPTQDMYNLLCAAYDAKADSKDLSARVVTQMLFTGKIDHLEEAYEISKKSHCVSGKLDRAVLVVRCHESLMKESVLSQEMQDTLEQW